MFEHVNLAASFAAGIVSFLSPCVFPLVPSFLSYLSGNVTLSARGDAKTPHADARVANKRILVMRTLFFVCGFTVLFVLLGYIFSSAGILLGGLSTAVNIVAGSFIVLLGFHRLFNMFHFLQREARVQSRLPVRGNLSAFTAGVAFGAGWSPCIGPFLTSILLLATQSSSTAVGITYLSLYGIGLGMPFVLITTCVPIRYLRLFFDRYGRQIKWIGGIMLVVIGLLILFSQWRVLNGAIVRVGRQLEHFAGAQSLVVLWTAVAFYLLLIAFCLYRIGRLSVCRRRRAAAPPRIRWRLLFNGALAALATVLAIAEYAGSLQTVLFVARWLQFRGI